MLKETLIQLPKKEDRRGNLSFLEEGIQVPFSIARTYWIYNIPGGQKRGSHAYKHQEEIIVALSGSFDVVLDDGLNKERHQLNCSYKAIYVPNMTWRTLENFSTNSLCLIIASAPYKKEDYIRNYKEFQRLAREEAPFLPIRNEYSESHIEESEKMAHHSTVYDCSLLELPVIKHKGGNITPVHNFTDIPFKISRVFFVYDIPAGEKRGSHAHRYCHQLLVAASGSFEVDLDDGHHKRTVVLNNPMYGLYIPPGVWASEKNYSSGAVCLVLTSDKYDESEYIRKYTDFEKFRADGNKKI
ncbi:putative RmlC-like cupin family protein [Dysgonomonas sp. PH5-45]|uniref:WxcM-like domain-containing protein n=1 Tax=unclassified Dysgonomonas TaxID=2630389 RepID=UPI002476247E|nr:MULTISPECIES: WxcM-like domain-containing protein [unclassified Dysgonomonas]MDH6355816.1 putative RmlC-like cupin family protein [Dysgonomonas sp. PH5-45]MDH6388717.1 putative RmlC-like cupin family protein [Dysgonomonas sp. PH5-37]